MKKQHILAVVTLILLALPRVGQAQFTVTTNSDNTLAITSYIGTDSIVIIPDTIEGYPVAIVGTNAFVSNSNLTSVTICTNVTSIETEAFRSCANLASVTIPNSVTNIGPGAFAFCNSLISITIPGSVTYIDTFAFYYCENLRQVYFLGNAPATYTPPPFIYSGQVFDGDYNATAFFLPGTTGWDFYYEELPTWSSYHATNKDTITILKYVGFGGSVTIPSTMHGLPVTSIGTNAFACNGSLTNITIPSSVTNIASEAFYACTNLNKIIFQGNPPTFGASVFYGISNATVYYLPGSTGWGSSLGGLTAWTLYPFRYRTNNNAITITGYTGDGGAETIPSSIVGMPVTSIADFAFQYCYTLTSITIPSTVTNLGRATFRYDSALTNVTIPSSITSLNSSVFQGCGLSDIILPDSITSIGAYAFGFCPLTQLTIPDNVTNIGVHAFSHTALTSITIPRRVTQIGQDVFWSCTNLTAAYFLGNAPSVGSLVLLGENSPNIYYLSDTTGWGATFGGLPTVLWKPQVQASDIGFGVQKNQFSFNINWASGKTFVVEACTNFLSPVWQPVQTNTLISASFCFRDPQWANYPIRFYRIRWP